MFRNVESHFSQVPHIANQRSIFKRPCTHKTSGDVGKIYPIYCDIVYPGDTVSMTTSKVIRLQTLLTPILDNVYADIYWFFEPLRLCWTHWKEFMGENTESAWVPETTYQCPTISSPENGFAVGTIADHLGLPVGVEWSASDRNAPFVFPFRAYADIVDQYFRDQNLTDPLNIPRGDSNQTGTNGDSYINDVANGGMPFKAARYHDYFSSALPAPLKAAAPVEFPLISGRFAPVYGRNTMIPYDHTTEENPNAVRAHFLSTEDLGMYGFNQKLSASTYYVTTTENPITQGAQMHFDNLWADLSTTVGAVTVNQLRLAFQLQKYYERLALGGSRYTEIIKSMFNISSPDGRLQRPEYLGGNRIPIQIHEVTNTAQSESDFLGDLGAMSRTSDVHYDFQKSFTEHGVLMGLMVLRTDRSYSQGFEPFWLRKQTTDWYFPQFANIGETPIDKCCIYADGLMDSDEVWGYQEAWADLRYKPNYVSGEMRPGVTNTLASWHLADYYESKPTLSDTWIREDVSNLDRCLAVTSTNANQFFADIYFDSTWTRCLPMYSVPGLIDHH